MTCFLTSNITFRDRCVMIKANQLVDELARRLPSECRALFVCSDPDNDEATDFYADYVKRSLAAEGFSFGSYQVLDSRNESDTCALVKESDLIILAGGHVPTQNAFFQKIGLKEALAEFSGIVIGISAGSMNSAETVYAQPELPGEAVDPSYQRFLSGLGLTKTMLIPHYYSIKDEVLDGLRIIDEITLPDSTGRTFYLIPDGSYLLIEDGREEIHGEAYKVSNGSITRIADDGDVIYIGKTNG